VAGSRLGGCPSRPRSPVSAASVAGASVGGCVSGAEALGLGAAGIDQGLHQAGLLLGGAWSRRAVLAARRTSGRRAWRAAPPALEVGELASPRPRRAPRRRGSRRAARARGGPSANALSALAGPTGSSAQNTRPVGPTSSSSSPRSRRPPRRGAQGVLDDAQLGVGLAQLGAQLGELRDRQAAVVGQQGRGGAGEVLRTSSTLATLSGRGTGSSVGSARVVGVGRARWPRWRGPGTTTSPCALAQGDEQARRRSVARMVDLRGTRGRRRPAPGPVGVGGTAATFGPTSGRPAVFGFEPRRVAGLRPGVERRGRARGGARHRCPPTSEPATGAGSDRSASVGHSSSSSRSRAFAGSSGMLGLAEVEMVAERM
jgi:hypothetical protein